MTRRATIVGAVALAAIAGVLVAWFLVLPRLRPHVFNAQVIQGVAAPSVSLEGPGGEPVALTDFEDKVVVLYLSLIHI